MTASKTMADTDGEARQAGLSRVGKDLILKPHVTRFVTNLPKRTRENIKACSVLGLSYWAEHPGRALLWAVDHNQKYHVVHIDRSGCYATHSCGIGEARQYAHGTEKCRGKSGTRVQYLACERLDTAALDLAIPSGIPARAHATLSRIYRSTPTFFDSKDWETTVPAEPGNTSAVPVDLAPPRPPVVVDVAPPKPAKTRTPRRKNPVRTSELGELVPPRMTLEAAIKLIMFDPDDLTDIPSERLVEALGQTPHDAYITDELAARGLTPKKGTK